MERKNKSQQKREALAIQDLGKRLVGLSSDQLRQLSLPQDILDAVEEAQRIRSHEAKRRQILFIASLMRNVDVEPINQALTNLLSGKIEGTRLFHKLEHWRDCLLDGQDDILDQICKEFPEADRQQIGQLTRNARKEAALDKPRKSARALFRALRDLAEKPSGKN